MREVPEKFGKIRDSTLNPQFLADSSRSQYPERLPVLPRTLYRQHHLTAVL